jgi:hypothetical protein
MDLNAADNNKEKLDASFMENPQSPGDPIIEEAPRKSNIFGDVNQATSKNLNILFDKAANDQPKEQSQSLFSNMNSNKNDDNPFVASGNKSMENRTSLNDIINRNGNSMFNETTPSTFQTGAPTINPFLPATAGQSQPKTSLFGGQATSMFGNQGQQPSGLFGAATTGAPGLFSGLGAGSATTTGLFGGIGK